MYTTEYYEIETKKLKAEIERMNTELSIWEAKIQNERTEIARLKIETDELREEHGL